MRLSGHRPQPTTAILIGGAAVAVEGARAWRVTVPLKTARAWTRSSGDALMLTLADTRTGTERVERVPLPPGALGRRLELATLLVRAR